MFLLYLIIVYGVLEWNDKFFTTKYAGIYIYSKETKINFLF